MKIRKNISEKILLLRSTHFSSKEKKSKALRPAPPQVEEKFFRFGSAFLLNVIFKARNKPGFDFSISKNLLGLAKRK